MGNRPGTLAKIEKGKSIYSVVGFADTWNWLVACMANMKAGRGLKLKWPADDTPEFSLDKEDDGDGGDGDGGGGEEPDPSTVKAVADIVDTPNSETGATVLDVSYTDGSPNKQITIPGGGKITFHGTGATYTSGTEFTFKSKLYSNVEVDCTNNEISIGAYYT